MKICADLNHPVAFPVPVVMETPIHVGHALALVRVADPSQKLLVALTGVRKLGRYQKCT